MIQIIKKADPWLHSFVLVIMVIIAIAGLVCMIAMFAEEMFISGLASILSAAILCLGLWAYYIFSGYFFMSALNKGFYDVAYIRYPFFLGIAGYLLVCSLPNVNGNVTATEPAPSVSCTGNPVPDNTSASSRSQRKTEVEKPPVDHIDDQYMREHTNIPYWCNSCGKAGPYPGSCPECYSGAKKYNPNYQK